MKKNLFAAGMGLALSLATVLPASAAEQVLASHVVSLIAGLKSTGQLPAGQTLKLAIGLPLKNQTALDGFLQQVYDPSSPAYHHFLTPAEFTAAFGPSQADYQKVIQFAKTNGLAISGTYSNRLLLDVTGNVLNVEKAFHVILRTYQHPTEHRQFFAPDRNPTVDSSIPIFHVSGLNNYALPRPLLLKSPASAPQGGSYFGSYIGSDFRNAYAPGVTLTGSGQSVGLLQFDSGFYQSDITAYETQAGISTSIPIVPILLDGYNGGPGIANDEVSLDIEMVISMAPGISTVYVFEGDNTDDILNAMAQQSQIKQLSASWSYPIDAETEQIFKQFAAQGQSFFNASGDYDAWVGPIYTPLDDPYITIVGGTTLTTAADKSWQSETVWNWGNEYGSAYDGIGSGGGISTTYSIPSWQTNVNFTASGGSSTMRNIPDVALTADNVAVFFGGGASGVFGGTSAATPLWAGFMALVNEQAVASGKPSMGFINPALYGLLQSPNYTSDFHDITTGNNEWSQSPNRFVAVPGYDLCTGLGTPNGTNLINALVTVAATHVSAPLPPYGSSLSALDGGNPNGAWGLFIQDDQVLDSGNVANGWILNLATATPVGFAADNALSMSVSTNSIILGGAVNYFVGVTNWGPSSATNVFVYDSLPSQATLLSSNLSQGSLETGLLLTWNVGNLAVNSGALLTLTVQPGQIGAATNSATVTAFTPDPNPADDAASASVIVAIGAPPQIATNSVVVSNGKFQFNVINQPGLTNVIEAATNLSTGPWLPVYTNVGSFTYTNIISPGAPDQFFRDRVGP
ncbi:MAG: DUF11 domain-containing protein [Verrucomicrobia bacterium]|nr:DUF11 domain-containing protein [Verrucomicrobiota bacterium]MDE3099219.1 DUF11 domain-containing protein [Verrucomicrobiota bacterium]